MPTARFRRGAEVVPCKQVWKYLGTEERGPLVNKFEHVQIVVTYVTPPPVDKQNDRQTPLQTWLSRNLVGGW